MAKNVVSFSLEDDLVALINKVQKEKKLSSRSAALERILLSFAYGNNTNNSTIENTVIDAKPTNAVKEDKKFIIDNINDSLNNMPDK